MHPLDVKEKLLSSIVKGKTVLQNLFFFQDFETVRWGNSLFSRIEAICLGKGNSSIIALDLQYRTNKIVILCLNKMFDQSLKIEISGLKFPLYSYRAFDLRPYRTDADDAMFVANIILCILRFSDFKNVEKPVRIGVIVPFHSVIPGITMEIERR